MTEERAVEDAVLESIMMIERIDVLFGDRSCEVRLVCVAERRGPTQGRWPSYDAARQFEVHVVARGVSGFQLLDAVAGRPGVEGLNLESLAGRQYESLRWNLSDMEQTLFRLSCEEIEVDSVVLDPHRWRVASR